MKKILSLILAVLMLAALCGCGGGNASQGTSETTQPIPEKMMIGFGREVINPDRSVPIAGLGRTTSRMSQSIHDPLYISCIAITDEAGESMLLFSVDLQRADMNIFTAVREELAFKTGISAERMYFVATHTHSGPDTLSAHASIEPYKRKVAARTVDAALAAIDDQKPATLAISSVETERMNFVKHYKYLANNGRTMYFGDNFGTAVYGPTTKHATEVDPTMHIVHVIREDGKDIVLANWRAHPHLFTAANSYKISADFVGAFRTAIEQKYDCYFAYFQGASGNINNKTRLSYEERTMDYGTYGNIMAEYALTALQNEVLLTDTQIQSRTTQLQMEQNHTEDNLIYAARKVSKAWNEGASYANAVAAGGTSKIHSPYHANAIIKRYDAGEFFVSELNAVSIGDALCFVTAPHELFDTNSVWLEENSPYAMTLTFGYTNGNNGYVPSAEAFEYGCYEADCTNASPGAGELIQQTFLDMLNEMKNVG